MWCWWNAGVVHVVQHRMDDTHMHHQHHLNTAPHVHMPAPVVACRLRELQEWPGVRKGMASVASKALQLLVPTINPTGKQPVAPRPNWGCLGQYHAT